MKKCVSVFLILSMMLCCAGAVAQEYITLSELREQAKNGWHESYTDKYGREMKVDIDVEVFGEDTAPVVKVKPTTLKVNSSLMEEGAVFKNRTLYRNNPADDIFGARSGQVTMIAHHTYGEKVDLDKVYAEEYGTPLTILDLKNRAEDVLAPHGVTLDDFLFDQPKEFSVRFKMSRKTQEVLAPAGYLAHFWQTMYGLPIFEHINRAYQKQSWPEFAPQSVIVMRESDEYSIVVDAVEEIEMLAQDIPLCSFERVKESIEEKIESGNVQKIYSMRFGYVVFNDADYPKDMKTVYDADCYYLTPTWVIECMYKDNAKDRWVYTGSKSDELCENEKNSTDYYLMMVNAQTGEVYERSDRSNGGKGDSIYKGYVSWDEVK